MDPHLLDTWIKKCIASDPDSKDFQKFGNKIANGLSNYSDLAIVRNIVLENISFSAGKSTYLRDITDTLIKECYKDLSSNIYHTPIHISQVSAFSYVLISKCEGMFSDDEKILMLIASLAHDLCHDGTNHVNNPFFLENKAAKKTRLILEGFQFPEAGIVKIEKFILMTDSSIRDNLYKANHADSTEKFQLVINSIGHPLLTNINRRDAYLGGILADADMFCSIGLGFQQHVKQTILVSKEIAMLNKADFNGVEKFLITYFLEEIIGNKFCSPIGNDFLYSLKDIKNEFSDNSVYEM